MKVDKKEVEKGGQEWEMERVTKELCSGKLSDGVAEEKDT